MNTDSKEFAFDTTHLSDEQYALILSEQLNNLNSVTDMDEQLALLLQKEEDAKQNKSIEQNKPAEQNKYIEQNKPVEQNKPTEQNKPIEQNKIVTQPAAVNYSRTDGFNKVNLSKLARKRIFQDLKAIIVNKDPTIHVYFDDDISIVEAIIVGPAETPYAGGIFHFTLRLPETYPWHPPHVTLRTTDNGIVRFNPNLYNSGKVCLSILGTWPGPGWTCVQTLLSTLLSIQSLMNKFPFHNEPAHEHSRNYRKRDSYNDFIRHETIRVAVLGMMDRPTWGENETLNEIRNNIFINNLQVYEATIKKNLHLDGRPLIDMYHCQKGNFRYRLLWDQLQILKKKYTTVS